MNIKDAQKCLDLVLNEQTSYFWSSREITMENLQLFVGSMILTQKHIGKMFYTL